MTHLREHLLPAVIAGLIVSACTDISPPISSPQRSAPTSTTTVQYVYSHVLQSDADIAQSVGEGAFIKASAADLQADDFTAYQHMAAKMGLHPTPALYINTRNSSPAPKAEARFTREGNSYVVINRSALDKWTPEQLQAVLGHELVHLREKHVTAGNITVAFNYPALSIAHEMEADRVGSGPLGSCNPQALAEAIEIAMNADRDYYLRTNPASTDEDYNQIVGPYHPNWTVRKAQLDALAAHPPQACQNASR